MTTAEMIENFGKIKDLYQAPYYDESDVLMFLNNAIVSTTDSFFPYEKEGVRKYQKNQRSTDSIHTLIKTEDLNINTSAESLHTRAVAYVELPEDYRHFETCEIKFDDVYAEKITVVTYDEVNLLFNDPFSTPDNKSNVYICWHNGKILIFAESEPTLFRLIYCKHPAKISDVVNCDLPLLMHEQIVKLAVMEAMSVAEEETRAKLSPLLNN